MKIPLFSIVILTYNEEQTIGKLFSKLQQILNKNSYSYEVIVIDSESTDRTLGIIHRYKKGFKTFRLVQRKKKDFHFSRVRNFSVRIARGKYLCFISADVTLKETKFLDYFLEDFQLNTSVVAIFGKQEPYKNTPIIQKIEWICRFVLLDSHVDSRGVLVQNLKKPFIPFNAQHKFWWYALFNTFVCYKRSFLKQHPFPETDTSEDIMLGKYIIENGYSKIYDKRCIVEHSHILNIWEYYQRQGKETRMKISKLKIGFYNNLLCKILYIKSMKVNLIKKFYIFTLLFFHYLIKLFALIEFLIKNAFYKLRFMIF